MDTVETKRDFIKRIEAEGRFEEFKKVREEAKKNGVPEKEAWRSVAHLFPPLNLKPGEQAPIVLPYKSTVAKIPGAKRAERPKPAEPAKPEPTANIEIDGSGGIPDSYKPQFVYQGSKDAVPDEVAAMALQIPDERRATEVEIVRWVFQNWPVPWDQIDPESVPCRGALSLLCFAKASATNYSTFLTHWAKIMPNKTQMLTSNRFADDERQNFDLLDAFDASLKQQREKQGGTDTSA